MNSAYQTNMSLNSLNQNKRKVLISSGNMNGNTINISQVTDAFKNLQNDLDSSRVDFIKSRNTSNKAMGMSKSFIDSTSNVKTMNAMNNTMSSNNVHKMTGFRRK